MRLRGKVKFMGGEREEILRNLSNELAAGMGDEAAARKAILALFRIIEEDAERIRRLQEEVQRLRDEINGLKGEQGKPDIRPKNRNKNSSTNSMRNTSTAASAA